MAGLLDPQPYGLLGDIRQYTGLPSRAISGLLDWYQSQPSVADRMASEYQGGLSAMDAAGQGLPERLKALAAYKHANPETAALAMDFGGMLGSVAPIKGQFVRRTNSPTPQQGVDYMMFKEVPEGLTPLDVADTLSGYGKNGWLVENPTGVDVADIQKDIVRALREAGAHRDYQTTAANLAREANPANIVDSAGIWDAPDLVSIIYERILGPRGISAVRTKDGLLSFDPATVARLPLDD